MQSCPDTPGTQDIPGHENGDASGGGPIDAPRKANAEAAAKPEAAARFLYSSRMCAELRDMAASDGGSLLAYLLDMARLEAESLAERAATRDTGRGGSVTADAADSGETAGAERRRQAARPETFELASHWRR